MSHLFRAVALGIGRALAARMANEGWARIIAVLILRRRAVLAPDARSLRVGAGESAAAVELIEDHAGGAVALVRVTAPVCHESELPAPTALRLNAGLRVGTLVVVDEQIAVRAAAPLASVTAEHILRTLDSLAETVITLRARRRPPRAAADCFAAYAA